MAQVIIYKSDDGGVAVVVPAVECLRFRTIEEIAQKDVPEGKPYKIIDETDLPSDSTFFNAWEVDEADLTDGVGAEGNEFAPLTIGGDE